MTSSASVVNAEARAEVYLVLESSAEGWKLWEKDFPSLFEAQDAIGALIVKRRVFDPYVCFRIYLSGVN